MGEIRQMLQVHLPPFVRPVDPVFDRSVNPDFPSHFLVRTLLYHRPCLSASFLVAACFPSRRAGRLRSTQLSGLLQARATDVSLFVQDIVANLSPPAGLFALHVEDTACAGASLNIGPAPKVWFFVPPQFRREVRLFLLTPNSSWTNNSVRSEFFCVHSA
jgi:hypothetical protein